MKMILTALAVAALFTGSMLTGYAVYTKLSEAKSPAIEEFKLIVLPKLDKIPSIQQPAPKSGGPVGSTEVITLTKENTVTFRGEVTGQKVAETQLLLMKKSATLAHGSTVYLVLDTPGGSVHDGNQLMDTIKALPIKVKTITVFAASMGFHFVQNLDERLILPSGTLMSHRASIGRTGGEIPGELIVRLNHLLAVLTGMDAVAAQRMGIDLASYQSLIRDEYWVSGQAAVDQKAADRVVLAKCDSSLMGTTKELLIVFMGIKVYGIMSECPVVSGILGIEIDGARNESDKEKILSLIHLYKTDKSEFIRNHVSTKNQ